MSSVHRKNIPNHEVIVRGEAPEIFVASPDSRLATVIFGEELYPKAVSRDLFRMYLQFRANVYVDQTNMISPDKVREDSTENDEDDERSYHMGVFRNLGNGAVSIEACMRLIQKQDEKILPVEEHFPDAFIDAPAPIDSLEVSRLISRMDDRRENLMAIANIFNTGVARTVRLGHGPAYGMVEPPLEKALAYLGAPSHRIAEPRLVEAYNDDNLGLVVDVPEIVRRVGRESLDKILIEPGGINYWN